MKIDKPIVYVPFGLAIVLCVVLLSFEFNHFSLAKGIRNIAFFALAMAAILGVFVFFKFGKQLDSDNLFVLTGSTVLFSFVVILSLSSFLNRQYATTDCKIASYEIVDYQARFASGYGKLEKGKPKANQWILTLLIDGKKESYVLKKDISPSISVTNTVEMEFCYGALGTKYLNDNP